MNIPLEYTRKMLYLFILCISNSNTILHIKIFSKILKIYIVNLQKLIVQRFQTLFEESQYF